MALSGTIYGTTSNQYIIPKIEWSATQSISANTSTITANLYYRKSSASSSATYGTISGRIYIGSSYTSYSKTVTFSPNNSYVFIGSYTLTVNHENDGTKKLNIYATGAISGTTLTSTSFADADKLVSLTTIPRAATLNSLSCSTSYLNGNITYKYTPTTANYYVRGSLSLNVNGTHTTIRTDNNGKPADTSQKSKVITLNSEQLNKIYNKLPSATKGVLRLTLYTYSDSGYSNQIGDAVYKEISLTIPDTVKPTIGALSLTPSAITLVNPKTGGVTTNTTNVLVQGKNKLTIQASDVTPGAGSSIAYYTFNGYNASGAVIYTQKITTTATSQAASINSINHINTLKFTVTATDARGRTSLAAEQQIVCYEYTKPSITSFSAVRSEVDGINYLNCTYDTAHSPVNGVNATEVAMYYNDSYVYGSQGTASVNIGNDTTSTYKIYLIVRDKFGGYAVTTTKTVYGEARVMNVTSDGTGIAFGKMAETKQLFECRWKSQFDELLVSKGGVRTEADGANNKYFEARRTNPPDAADNKHNNVKMQMYVGDSGHPTIRNQYSTDNGSTWTTRSYLKLQDDGVYANGFRVPEVQYGSISITPSAANTPTAKAITFTKEFSGTPTVIVSADTAVPGTAMLGVGTANRSTTGCTIYLTRINTVATTVNWIALY